MFPYWVLFSSFAAGALRYQPDPRRGHRQGGHGLLFVAFCMMLMVGWRYEVGGDWINYLRIFHFIEYHSFTGALSISDPGYGALNWIAAQLGLGIVSVNFVCAAVFTWGLVKFARIQPNPWLVILVAIPYLVIVVSMGYTRQAVAIGFVLAALATFETSLRYLIIYLALAAMFHKSAVVVVPLIALTANRHRFITPLVVLATGALLYYLFLESSVDTLVTNYVFEQYESQGAMIRVLMNLPAAALFLLFSRRFGASMRAAKLWRNFSIAALAAVALLVVSPNSAALDRLSLYLIPLQLFVLARIPLAFAGRSDRSRFALALFVIAYSAVIQFIWLNYAVNADYWLPYRFAPLEMTP